MRSLFIIFSICMLSACNLTSQPKTVKSVEMYNRDGDMVGTAKLKESPDGVEMELKLEGVPPGWHGLHIHEIGKCEAPDFKSAGNHFNPENKEHGLLQPKGPHVGDLPNIEADHNGKVEETIMISEATLLEGKNSLTEKSGTAIIITSDKDDGITQISGNSGERIICGEIKGEDEQAEEKPSDPAEEGEEEEE